MKSLDDLQLNANGATPSRGFADADDVGVRAIVQQLSEGKVCFVLGGDDAQLQRSFDLFEQVRWAF